eukprot:CFRG1334T1
MQRSGLKPVSDSQLNSINGMTGRMSMGAQRMTKKTDNTSRKSMIPIAPNRGVSHTTDGTREYNSRKSISNVRQSTAARGDFQPVKPNRPSTGYSRQSLSNSRQSMSRRSSIYGERTTFKDTRPLGDKEYRKQCCAAMFRYLTANGYSHPMSLKLLTAPMMRDFLRIFQFLYSQLDQQYKFPENKTEKAIPEVIILMKGVRYPFAIKQSSLLAFTPMEWPSLLGALHWLVELCTYSQGIGPTPYFSTAISDFEEGAPSHNQNQTIFEYVSRAYANFMQGVGDDDDDDQDISLFSERKMVLEQRKEQLDRGIEELREELLRYRNEPSPLQEATQMKLDCESDKRKFVRVIQDYERKLQSRSKKLEEKNQLVDQAKKEQAELVVEGAHLTNVLNNQELSATDVLRINMDREQLKNSLEEAHKQREESDMKLFDREKEISFTLQEIQRKIYTYHELADTLCIMPVTAKNAMGVNFELEFKSTEPQPEQMLSVYLKGTIKPALQELKCQYGIKIRQSHAEMLEAEEEHEQMNEELIESTDRLNSLREKMFRLESLYREKKETMNSILKSLQVKEDEVEDKVNQLDMVYNDASLQRLQQQYDEQVKRQETERQQIIPSIYASLNDAVSLKEHVSDQLDMLNKLAITARDTITNLLQ